MKRVIGTKAAKLGIIAVVIACLLLSGCNSCAMMASLHNGESVDLVFDSLSRDVFGEHDQTVMELTMSLPVSAHYEAVAEKTGYDSLTSENQREAYNAMERSVFRFTNEGGGERGVCQLERAYIPNLTSAEIYMVKEAVYYDHPEAFWLSRNYSLDFNFKDGHFIVLYSLYSYEDAMVMARGLENALSAYLIDMPRSMNEYERELYIHDRLVSECEYDYTVLDKDMANSAVSGSYGALVNHSAICGGYTMAAKLLLNCVGIKSYAVHGIADGYAHVWLLVNIEGEWYHLDVTWDDPILSEPSSLIQHTYFNVTDEMIMAEHELCENFEALTEERIQSGDAGSHFYNFTLPTADSIDYNYFTQDALLISNLSDASGELIVNEAVALLENGKTELNLRFDSGIDAVAANEWLISDENALRMAMESVGKRSNVKIGKYIVTSYMEHEVAYLRRVYVVQLIAKNS